MRGHSRPDDGNLRAARNIALFIALKRAHSSWNRDFSIGWTLSRGVSMNCTNAI